MKSRNQLKWGSILSYIQMIMSVIIGLVYTPIMIRLLGKNEYGLYNTVSSTISMLSVLSLGFNAGYVRFLARYRKEQNDEKISSLNGLYLIIFLIIGIIALGCGLFLANNLRLVFKDGLQEEEYETAKVLMILLSINLAINFPMSVFSTIISANERFIFLKAIGTLRLVINPLINLPLLLMGFKSVGLVATTLAFEIITDVIFYYYVRVKLKNKFQFKYFEHGLFKELFAYTGFIAINIVVDLINTNVDRVLLGRYQGTAVVAVYAIGANLYAHYKSISTAISGVFTPRIHYYYNNLDNQKERNECLTDLFIRVGRIQFLILMLFASGMVFFGKPFIRFWAGEGFEESYIVMLLLTIPASIPLIQNLGIEIQRAANMHQFRSIVYIIMAVLNLILTIFLCQKYGAVGATIGTALSVLVANGLIMNIYYHRKIGINIPLFWNNIGRILLGMIPAFIVGGLIMHFVNIKTIWVLIGLIILYFLVYTTCIWNLSMNTYEKKLIKTPILKVLSKKK